MGFHVGGLGRLHIRCLLCRMTRGFTAGFMFGCCGVYFCCMLGGSLGVTLGFWVVWGFMLVVFLKCIRLWVVFGSCFGFGDLEGVGVFAVSCCWLLHF